MKRPIVFLSTALLSLLAFAPVAVAGEWAPGLNDHNGSAGHAQSECVYNGRDDPDAEDDAMWSQTPAGGRVQSGGQATAAGARAGDPNMFIPTGIQGFACNPQAAP
jgi:hypothetical protein